MNKRSKIILLIVIVALVIVLAVILFSVFQPQPVKLDSFTEFKEYVYNITDVDLAIGDTANNIPADEAKVAELQAKYGDSWKTKVIRKVEIAPYQFYGYINVGDKDYVYYVEAGPSGYDIDSEIVKEWEALGVKVSYANPNAGSVWSSLLSILVPVALCVIFYIIIANTMGGGSKALSFGKSKAKISTNIKVRFTDVAGAEEEKEELQEITEFLKNPQKFSDLGARIPKGVLLVGPPGTGKTLFAKAVAGEAGVPFFAVSGSDFVEMYVGVGASRVRDIFEIAKKNQPCIIFIDEIDAVGRERGAGLGGGSDEREQTLNQILVQMDGFESNEAVIVMAATNRSDVLDPALMRPGRFDRKIMVNLPDVKGREAILRVHARNKPLAPDVNFKTIARMTSGFSGADLENLLNEAAILAARASKKLIGNVELYEGINKVMMGPQKKSHLVTEADKRRTAYHEAGHAIIAQVCPMCDPVQEVSIIPRGMAAGYTLTRPDTDDRDYTKNKLSQMICMMLGGRVAEELVIEDVTTGASNDLQRVSNIARRMVIEWGMSEKVGLISYGEGKPVFIGRQIGSSQEYSDATAALIDQEVHKIVADAHDKATEILTKYRQVLDNMARILVEKETIYSEEVAMLMKGCSVEEVVAAMEEIEKKSSGNPFEHYEHSIRANAPQADGEGSENGEKTVNEGTTPAFSPETESVETTETDDKDDKGE